MHVHHCKECGETYNIGVSDEATVGTKDTFSCKRGTHSIVRYAHGWNVFDVGRELQEEPVVVTPEPKKRKKR